MPAPNHELPTRQRIAPTTPLVLLSLSGRPSKSRSGQLVISGLAAQCAACALRQLVWFCALATFKHEVRCDEPAGIVSQQLRSSAHSTKLPVCIADTRLLRSGTIVYDMSSMK